MTVATVFADAEARSLLLASFARARTAWDLSERTGVPIARCYRILHRLLFLGLVTVERIHVTSRGRGKPVFRARLPRLELFLRGGRVLARISASPVSQSGE